MSSLRKKSKARTITESESEEEQPVRKRGGKEEAEPVDVAGLRRRCRLSVVIIYLLNAVALPVKQRDDNLQTFTFRISVPVRSAVGTRQRLQVEVIGGESRRDEPLLVLRLTGLDEPPLDLVRAMDALQMENIREEAKTNAYLRALLAKEEDLPIAGLTKWNREPFLSEWVYDIEVPLREANELSGLRAVKDYLVNLLLYAWESAALWSLPVERWGGFIMVRPTSGGQIEQHWNSVVDLFLNQPGEKVNMVDMPLTYFRWFADTLDFQRVLDDDSESYLGNVVKPWRLDNRPGGNAHKLIRDCIAFDEGGAPSFKKCTNRTTLVLAEDWTKDEPIFYVRAANDLYYCFSLDDVEGLLQTQQSRPKAGEPSLKSFVHPYTKQWFRRGTYRAMERFLRKHGRTVPTESYKTWEEIEEKDYNRRKGSKLRTVGRSIAPSAVPEELAPEEEAQLLREVALAAGEAGELQQVQEQQQLLLHQMQQ